MKKIKGVVYNFYPVETKEGDDDFESCDTWHWKFFGWWFEMYTWMRAIIAEFIGVEIPFIIKVKNKDIENE